MSKHKLRRPICDQVEMNFSCIDETIPAEHQVRMVWTYVESLDVELLLGKLKTFCGVKGAPATDPRVLLALWLFATLDGVGSAREIDRLCKRDLVYRWIVGGVSVNHTTLAKFRSTAGPFLDDLLTKSVAALVKAEVVDLSTIAVDSMRVKADAGTSSFRRAPTLKELEAKARARVEELKATPQGDSARRRAAQQRAASERARRVAAAIAAAEEIEAARAAEDAAKRVKNPKPRNEVRASTTDPQARNMAMAGRAFGPAYNVQVKTDPKAGVIVGLEVGANASDRGQLTPAVAEIERRHGKKPKAILADVGYDGRDDINAVEAGGTAVYVPLPTDPGKQGIKQGDEKGVCEWKQRMTTDQGKTTYAYRINTEHAHAQMRNHGLRQFPVRGLDKVKAVALLFAVAMNLLLHGPTLLAAAA